MHDFRHKMVENHGERGPDVASYCSLCGLEQENNPRISYRFLGEKSWTEYGREIDCVFLVQKHKEKVISGLNNRKPYHCFDCRGASASYMVRNEVWLKAWPDYENVKRNLKMVFSGTPFTHLELCISCLEKRLGRNLNADDFDLNLPINHGIALGLRMAKQNAM